jgi:AcrR family transcriptional regulator
LYYHHGSKQGLLVALFDVAMDDLLLRLQVATDEAGEEPSERFRNIIEAIALHMTYRLDLAILDSELRYLDPTSRAHYASLRDKVQRLLRNAINDGVKREVFNVRYPADTTRALLGMLQAIASWYHLDGPITPRHLAERYVEIALSAVGADTVGRTGRHGRRTPR